MKLILIKSVALFSILAFSFSANSQSLKQKVADKYFDQLNYVNAVDVYEDIASGKGKDYHSLKRTAECYRLMNDISSAVFWYNEVIVFGTNIPKDYYYYAQLLKSSAEYKLSDDNMKLFYEKAGKGTFTSVPNFYEKLKQDSIYFMVNTVECNSSKADLAPVVYNEQLIFVSNRNVSGVRDVKVGWDNTGFLEIYNSGLRDSVVKPILFFGKDLTKNSHDGPIYFDTINNKIYITRNNLSEKIQNKNLKLFVFENSEDKWHEAEEFKYNSDEYSVGHSTLTPDGKTMYFTSNMPGGYGETDIWKTDLENGEWGMPINLGEGINTFDKEMFPSISPSGDLYFASKGHQGFGGLDIFVAYKNGDEFMKPVNMGYPINTRFDDFSFTILDGNKFGYFSSNRVGGKGSDDIYNVEIKKQVAKPVKEEELIAEALVKAKDDVEPIGVIKNIEPIEIDDIVVDDVTPVDIIDQVEDVVVEDINAGDDIVEGELVKNSEPTQMDVVEINNEYSLIGNLFDNISNTQLTGSSVELKNKTTGKVVEKTVGSNGFSFDLTKNSDYSVSFSNSTYISKTINFSTNTETYLITLNESLSRNAIQLNNIYYDFESYKLTSSAKTELDKLVDILIQYPNMSIMLNSHTDSKGKDGYNEYLSKKRAKSVVSYLELKGISTNRLSYKGYGESKLVNKCSNGVECSSAQHQENRRTEFVIVK
jgi:outer membrane protein OmpA-like peptidoglycan-associated protein